MSSKFVTVKAPLRVEVGAEGHRTAIPAVVTGEPSASGVEPHRGVLFLSCMPLGRLSSLMWAPWLFCTRFPRKLVKDFPVSVLFLVS